MRRNVGFRDDSRVTADRGTGRHVFYGYDESNRPMTSAGGDSSADGFSEYRPPVRAWTRTDDRGSPGDDDGTLPFDDLHFHRYCAVLPFGTDDPATRDTEADRDGVEIRYLTGVARIGLRHTPAIVLAATVIFFGSAELVDGVEGISAFLPTLNAPELLAIAVGAGLWGVLVGLLVHVELLTARELYKAGVVYGLLSLLAVGTAVSVGLVMSGAEGAHSSNVVFTSGYLLLLLLGGMLVYDGMLRTERLFATLGDTWIVGDEAERTYETRVKELAGRLTHSIPNSKSTVRMPTAYFFSIVFVSQIAVVWWIGRGPQNLDYSVTLAGNVVLDLFLVAVFFQFLVVIDWFYELVNDDRYGDEDSVLRYKPHHPDGHGGYRELGKFATRVNVLLILAGLYIVYRLYVQGSRVTYAEMAPSFDPTVGWFLWFGSFVLPMILYAIAAGAWLYYSFWQLHLRMVRERERYYVERLEDSFVDDLERWQLRTKAPVWPIDNGQLFSLVSGTFFPLVLWLFDVFF